ncbi:hypothetical protein CGLO_18153 [Colletotrichum gloeosporioides Cg-14]|uniref:Uncharacterized protein n=1 Tax=Colletotrichum gloeosporioides (strain Cg-14) TaxID=1237896 RepID=T0JS11_COLGC|nr:hypothetical protein CGLO_18153 [Colletotrichum gloeosporioides Cg-14]
MSLERESRLRSSSKT